MLLFESWVTYSRTLIVPGTEKVMCDLRGLTTDFTGLAVQRELTVIRRKP